MSNLPKLKLFARIGASADIPIRVESSVLQFAQITAMARTAPLRVTAPDHGIPHGWRAAVVGAVGMTDMNVAWDELRPSVMRQVSVIDANTVDFDGVCATGFGTYKSGGVIAFYQPKSLSDYTGARMDIKRNVAGSTMATLSTDDGTIEIDVPHNSVWLHVHPGSFLSIAPSDYVFDIELISAGNVIALCSADSTISILPEVTTSTN